MPPSDRHRGIPDVVIHLVHGRSQVHPRGIDQDVGFAERRHHLIGSDPHGIAGSQISGDPPDIAATVFHLARGSQQLVLIACHQHHSCPSAPERGGDGSSDTGAAARHGSHAAAQAEQIGKIALRRRHLGTLDPTAGGRS